MPWLLTIVADNKEKLILAQQRVKVGQTIGGQRVLKSQYVATTGRDYSILGDFVEIPVPGIVCTRCNYEYYADYQGAVCKRCGLGREFMKERPSVYVKQFARKRR